jgi:hypothetical protein
MFDILDLLEWAGHSNAIAYNDHQPETRWQEAEYPCKYLEFRGLLPHKVRFSQKRQSNLSDK